MVKYTGQLNRYFKKDSIADIVSELPKPVMTLTDMFFPANRRVQKHSSLISLEDITAETGAVPLVRRGGHSVPVDPNSKTVQFIDLDGIIISRFFKANEVNDLIASGDTENVQAWVNENIENLRNRISDTTETLVRQALSGKIEYPYATDTGVAGKMEIDLGTPNALTPANIKTANVGDLQVWLEKALTEHAKKAGSVNQPAFLLGSAVYSKVVSVVCAVQNAPVLWTAEGMKLFGKYDIRSLSMTYTLPGSNSPVDVIGPNKMRIVDLANSGKLLYAALDDLDANLAPMPFYCKPQEMKDPDGIKLIASSKPLPAFAMKRQSEQTVTTA